MYLRRLIGTHKCTWKTSRVKSGEGGACAIEIELRITEVDVPLVTHASQEDFDKVLLTSCVTYIDDGARFIPNRYEILLFTRVSTSYQGVRMVWEEVQYLSCPIIILSMFFGSIQLWYGNKTPYFIVETAHPSHQPMDEVLLFLIRCENNLKDLNGL